jgi:hypothetical protein
MGTFQTIESTCEGVPKRRRFPSHPPRLAPFRTVPAIVAFVSRILTGTVWSGMTMRKVGSPTLPSSMWNARCFAKLEPKPSYKSRPASSGLTSGTRGAGIRVWHADDAKSRHPDRKSVVSVFRPKSSS